MIIFQVTLTGPMLVHLAMLNRQTTEVEGPDAFDYLMWDGRYVSTVQNLIRQGLATHESPMSLPGQQPIKFADKKRKHVYEITPKGQAALELARHDLKDFIDQVSQKRLPSGSSYRTINQVVQNEMNRVKNTSSRQARTRNAK